MEWIIEDVVAVVDGDWEMMATVLVFELDAVRCVVGIGDFTVYVSDGDGVCYYWLLISFTTIIFP